MRSHAAAARKAGAARCHACVVSCRDLAAAQAARHQLKGPPGNQSMGSRRPLSPQAACGVLSVVLTRQREPAAAVQAPPPAIGPCVQGSSLSLPGLRQGRCRMKLATVVHTVGDSLFVGVIENGSARPPRVCLRSWVQHSEGILLFETYSFSAQSLQNFRSSRLHWELVRRRSGRAHPQGHLHRTPTSRVFLYERTSDRMFRSCQPLPAVPKFQSATENERIEKRDTRRKVSSQSTRILWNRCQILTLLVK